MKRTTSNKSLLALAICFVLISLVGIRSSGAAAGQIVLRFAGNLPADHFVTRGQEFYAKQIETKTKGKVRVEVYPSGQLFSDKDLVRALPMGAVDMAEATCAQWTGIQPLWLMFDLPLFFKDRPHWHRVVDSEVGTMLKDEFDKKSGVKVLYWMDYGSSAFAAKMPLRTMEDFKGKRIRGVGEAILKGIQALGASPVFLGGGEVYLALQRGTIDGANSGISAIWERKHYEVAKYISGTDFTLGMFVVMINKKKWESLPADIQKAMTEAAEEAKQWGRVECDKADAEALALLKGKGADIYYLPEKEKLRWIQAVRPIAHEYYISRGGRRPRPCWTWPRK